VAVSQKAPQTVKFSQVRAGVRPTMRPSRPSLGRSAHRVTRLLRGGWRARRSLPLPTADAPGRRGRARQAQASTRLRDAPEPLAIASWPKESRWSTYARFCAHRVSRTRSSSGAPGAGAAQGLPSSRQAHRPPEVDRAWLLSPLSALPLERAAPVRESQEAGAQRGRAVRDPHRRETSSVSRIAGRTAHSTRAQNGTPTRP
jgi:hypothetical protein